MMDVASVTKAQLTEQAEALGLEVKPKDTKPEIAEAIEAKQAELAIAEAETTVKRKYRVLAAGTVIWSRTARSTKVLVEVSKVGRGHWITTCTEHEEQGEWSYRSAAIRRASRPQTWCDRCKAIVENKAAEKTAAVNAA